MRTRDAQLRRRAWYGAIGIYIVIIWFLGLGFRTRRDVVEIKIFSGAVKPVIFSGRRGGHGRRHGSQGPNGPGGSVAQPVVPAPVAPVPEPMPEKKPEPPAPKVPAPEAAKLAPEVAKPAVENSRRVIEPVAQKLDKKLAKKLERAKKAEQAKRERERLEQEKREQRKRAQELALRQAQDKQAKLEQAKKGALEQEKREQAKKAEKAQAKRAQQEREKLEQEKLERAKLAQKPIAKPGPPQEFFVSGDPARAQNVGSGAGDSPGRGEGAGYAGDGDYDGDGEYAGDGGDGSEEGMSRDGVALINAIGRTWRPPRGLSPVLSARAEVTIVGNGQVEDIKIVEGSGVLAYDMAVRASLLRTEYPRAFWGKTIAIVFGKLPAR